MSVGEPFRWLLELLEQHNKIYTFIPIDFVVLARLDATAPV